MIVDVGVQVVEAVDAVALAGAKVDVGLIWVTGDDFSVGVLVRGGSGVKVGIT